MAEKPVDLSKIGRSLWALLAPESNFIWIVLIYGVAIGLLTLAVPIALQTLINTIANIGSLRAVYILAVTLFLLLVGYGALSALRLWVVELYERHIYARLTAEMSYRVIRAPHSFFEGRQNAGITHRYFDIMLLQKNIPRLIVDGFALLLQMLVGFTLVSFYHPWLFLFNTLIVIAVYVVWRIWATGAKRTAVELSRRKYETAKWLSDLEVAHEFFKSSRHAELAGERTERATAAFIEGHKRYFSYTFQQTIMFLLLYALGSSALLGLGGWLVNIGQLSIGQLVAAELIMTSIFLGLASFSIYLKTYYELYGAADKVTELLSIPQEPEFDNDGGSPQSGDLRFNDVLLTRGDRACHMDMHLSSGRKQYVQADEAWIQRKVLNALRHHERLSSGWITLGGKALEDFDLYDLRQCIYSIDRSLIVECSILEFLQLSAPDASTDDIIEVLSQVHLWRLIQTFPDGLDTRMSVLGAPFQSVEILLLKLASAILAKPQVLVLNQRFDNVQGEFREQIMALLEDQPFTVLYFTSFPDDRYFDGCLRLSALAADEQAASRGEEDSRND